MSSDSITAVDYLRQQLALEKEAREHMPYDPNVCTYVLGPLKQQVYACLDCLEKDNGVLSGICYSCSVQCHSTHTLVELFTKRNFTCDCGTTRMKSNGACCLRTKLPGSRRNSSGIDSKSTVRQPAEDVPSLSNVYNHNFKGVFCSCEKVYNPVQETGNMVQCALGDVCGEDWFHDECLMGYPSGQVRRSNQVEVKSEVHGVNRLDSLGEAGLEAAADNDSDDGVDVEPLKGFPDLDDFDCIICWKCFAKHKAALSLLPAEIQLAKLAHIECKSEEEREKILAEESSVKIEDVPPQKKQKQGKKEYPETIFLKEGFKEVLQKVILKNDPQQALLIQFLKKFPFLYLEDPVYEPPEDEDDDASSLFDLGAKALNSLPREQAISGLQAYETIKSKLTTFLRPFAEEGKIVTEQEIRDFFEKETNER
ncbi:unnamed protein product [Kuraishia capsulata CBS 1993]|uniref:UBR-type domain-containing protein n=1 Tax=Kuraishia capsulata CBS 1993 TaxID=1382522 RepID=W6MT50_9ASCO|nr:uncharacterized protein KUCA_T00005540001 [Kuraishia capsulata CBS 1993]CDK29548.1 unnamed protein product [Kuraishia capsulata CBS 1993]